MMNKRHGNGFWSGCFTTLVAAAAIVGCSASDELATGTASQPLTGSGGTSASSIECGSGADVTIEVSGTNIVDVNPSDTMFIIDRSGSIGATGFAQDKAFMTSLVNSLPVDADHRIGIVTFSTSAELITNFIDDRATLLATIAALTYPGGTTCTSCGLDLADSKFQETSAAGTRRIGIVITDGAASVPTTTLQASIDQIKAHGVEVFAVGVGSAITPGELNRLASEPDPTHVFSVTSFGALETILANLVSAVLHPEATNATLALDINPAFAVSSASGVGGAVTQVGNELTWAIGAIQDETRTLTFHVQHASTDHSGSLPIVDSYTYTDDEGNTLSLPELSLDVAACDGDGDGVLDDDDQCPGTTPAAVVDAEGCSIEQLCPCAGPWRNHGGYVSCVSHAANDFLSAGLITQQMKGAIVSAAGQSSCGKGQT